MKTRMLAILLAAAMFLALFSACSSQTSSAEAPQSVPASDAALPQEAPEPAPAATPEPAPEEAPPAPEASAAEAPEPAPAVTIDYPIADGETITLWYEGDDNESTNNAWLAAQELTGVTVEISYASRQSADEQFSLLVASGDYTDIMDNVTDRYPGSGDAAIADDVIIDLGDYIETCLPDYYTRLTADADVAKDLVTDSGAYAAVYQLYDEVRNPDSGPVIRQDWLDAQGLEKPETYDEYENVLLALKDAYSLTSPILMLADGVPENNFLVAGYGVAGKTEEAGINYMPFYQVDGVVHYGILEEGFREYVEMLNRWYGEGLFAADFATLDNPGRDSIQASEMCALWYTGSSACGLGDEAGGMFKSSDPNYHVVAIPDAVKNKGDMNHLSTIAKYKTNHSMSVSTGAKDPELVTKWLNFWYTDMGSQLANYGVEGEGCTIDENGVPGFSELVTNNPDGNNYRDCLSLYTVTCVAYYSHVNRDMVTYNSDVIEAGTIWTSNRDNAYNYPDMALLNVEESEEFSRLYADLRTLIAERLPEFIMGIRPMDEWDGFLATLREMGIEDCISLKQAAYDRYMTR